MLEEGINITEPEGATSVATPLTNVQRVEKIVNDPDELALRESLKKSVKEKGYSPIRMAQEFASEIPGETVDARSLYIRRIIKRIMTDPMERPYIQSLPELVRDILTHEDHAGTRRRIIYLVEEEHCTAAQVLERTTSNIVWPVCSHGSRENRMQYIISKLVPAKKLKHISDQRQQKVLKSNLHRALEGQRKSHEKRGTLMSNKQVDALILRYARAQEQTRGFNLRHNHKKIAERVNAVLDQELKITSSQCRVRLHKILKRRRPKQDNNEMLVAQESEPLNGHGIKDPEQEVQEAYGIRARWESEERNIPRLSFNQLFANQSGQLH